MASGEKIFNTSTYIQGRLAWEETNVDIDSNTSTLWVSLSYRRTNSYGGYTSESGVGFHVIISGQWYQIGDSLSIPPNNNSWHEVGAKSITVTHNSDGSLAVGVGGYHNGPGLFNCNESMTATLTTIPRASVPSINTVQSSDNTFPLDSTITIYTNRKVNTFHHKVEFFYGNNSNRSTVVSTNAEDSVTFDTSTISSQFLTDNPNVTSLTGKIVVTTYNSSNQQIGSAQTINYTATIPDTYSPTLTETSTTIQELALKSIGVTDKVVVRYISRKHVEIEAVGKNGATISSAVIKNGNIVTNLTKGSDDVWSGTITSPTSASFIFEVVDSRGKTATHAISGISIVNYSYPTILQATLERTNASTGASEIKASGTFWNGTAGSVTNAITINYRLNTDSSSHAITPTLSGGSWNATANPGILDPDLSFSAVITATDLFGQQVSVTVQLPSAHNALWVGKKTVRVHDYLIADQDVWLNDGETKLSNFCDRNLINYAAWSRARSIRCTPIWENNGVTITATGDDAYLLHSANAGEFPVAARIPVTPGKTYIMTWDYSGSDPGATANAYIFPNGLMVQGEFVEALYTAKQLSYTAKSDDKFITWRFGVHDTGCTVSYKNVMIRESTRPDEYMPYNGLLGIKMQTIHWDSVSISSSSCTNIYFDLPRDFNRSLGCKIYYSWPLNNWNSGATVTIRADRTIDCGPEDAGKSIHVGVTSVSTQNFVIDMILYYI